MSVTEQVNTPDIDSYESEPISHEAMRITEALFLYQDVV
jgi:hypothetical protein